MAEVIFTIHHQNVKFSSSGILLGHPTNRKRAILLSSTIPVSFCLLTYAIEISQLIVHYDCKACCQCRNHQSEKIAF